MLSSLCLVVHLHMAEILSYFSSWKLIDSLSSKVLLTVVLSSCALFVQDLPLLSLSGSLTCGIDSVHELLKSPADSDTWAFP